MLYVSVCVDVDVCRKSGLGLFVRVCIGVG